MRRRIFLIALAAGGMIAGLLGQARTLRAAAGGYQYSLDVYGFEYCGGVCRTSPCCKIVPL